MVKNKRKILKDVLEGAKEIASNRLSEIKGYFNRRKMFGNLVEKEVKKQYPTGLADNPGNELIREKIAKEIKKKKPILKDIGY